MIRVNMYQMTLICGVASVFYIRGLIPQPIYLIGPLCIIFSIYYTIHTGIQYRKNIAISLLLILFILCNIIFLQIYVDANSGVIWNYSLCILVYISVVLLSYKLRTEECVDIILKVVWLLVLYALFDGVWRFLHPNPEQIFEGNPYFYRFKDNSLMFEDSNFVGAALVVSYGAIVYLKNRFKLRLRNITFWLYVSTLITFSRASIITLFFIEIFSFYWRFSNLKKILFLCFILLVTHFVISFLLEDGSFRTKFHIINLFINVYPHLSLIEKLLGVGLGNTFKYIGIGAHNVFVVYGFELGIIGTIFQLIILFIMITISNGAALFILFAYYVNSFSLTAIAIPVMFFLLAIVTVLSIRRSDG